LEFKPNYSVHVLPPRDQVHNNKRKNVTTKTTMVEFGKQLSINKSGKKTRTMCVRVDIVNELLIKLVIGLNKG
jgi:hypothetical protein